MKRRANVSIALLLGVPYAALLALTYRANYFAPDVRLYHSWGAQEFLARDGYSTLFIRIAGLIGWMDPATLIWSSAVMMTFAFVVMNYAALTLVRAPLTRAAVVLTISATGVWYYLFGKTFYDFPFTMFSFGLCMILATRFALTENVVRQRWLFAALGLGAGFTLSWKPYNVFEVWALACAAAADSRLREKVWRIMNPGFTLALTAVMASIGFALGNYGLLIDPLATLSGIRASPYQANLHDALFTTVGPVWDAVNFLGFDHSTFRIPSALVILFVLPALGRRWFALACSGITVFLFLVFIRYFTPGFPWHGFPMGVYLVLTLIFAAHAADALPPRRRTAFAVTLLIAALPQVAALVFSYVPTQLRWISATDDAIAVLTEQSSPILRDVAAYTDVVTGTFDVSCDIKRFRFVSLGEWQGLMPVFMAERPAEWQRVWSNPRYTYLEPEYLVRISLDAEARLADVLAADLVPANYRPVSRTQGVGYTVALYHRL